MSYKSSDFFFFFEVLLISKDLGFFQEFKSVMDLNPPRGLEQRTNMTIFGLEIDLLTLIPHFYMHELVPTEITPHKGLEILECNI